MKAMSNRIIAPDLFLCKFAGICTILFICSFLSLETSAQEKYYFKNLNTNNGLSQNTVNCLVQDNFGIVWIGTQDGLNRFDGRSFQVYRQNNKSPRISLIGSDITDLLIDKEGDLWIATRNGLSRYSYQTGTFSNFPIKHPTEKKNEELTKLVESDQAIIIGSRSGNIYSFDKSSLKVSVLFSEVPQHTLTLFLDHKQTLFVGFESGGLWKKEANSNQFSKVVNSNLGGDLSVTLITSINNSEYWVSSTQTGLAVYDSEFNLQYKISVKQNVKEQLVANSLLLRKNKEIWVGTLEGIFSVNGAEAIKVDMSSNKNPLGTDEQIGALFEDSNGLMWVGAYRTGIFQLTQKFGFITTDLQTSPFLRSKEIVSLTNDTKGNVWIGTWGSGLSSYDSKNHSIKDFPLDDSFLPAKSVFGLFSDGDSLLWIGTWSTNDEPSGGLSVYNSRTKTIKRFCDVQGTPFYSDRSIGVISINEDKYGRIWAGTVRNGIFIFDRKKQLFFPLSKYFSGVEFLGKSAIHTIYKDSKGKMWVGTGSEGVAIFDSDSFIRLVNSPQDSKSLQSNEIGSFYEDGNGEFWITTGKGLTKYTPSANYFTNYSTENGFPVDFVYCVIPGDKPFLWFSSNKGIIRLNIQNGKSELLSFPEIVGKEFNQGAYGRAPNGVLYFGNMNGLLFFHPQDVEISNIDSKIVLKDVKKFYQSIEYPSDYVILDQFEFDYDENVLTFEFAALDYKNPESIEYAFYLEGFDTKWSEVGAQNSITYTNLSPGDYTLKVRASNHSGAWSQNPLSLSIVISPPFYQATWFRILAFLLIILTFYGGYTFRINHLKRKQIKELENQRISGEINTARQMQENLLPHNLPESSLFNLEAVCKLAYETGGDFYDIFWLDGSNKKLCILSADVSGKSMQAAVISILIKGLLINLRKTGFTSASQVLRELNNDLKDHKPEKRMFTAMSIAIFDFEKRVINFCNAAQPEIILIRDDQISYISTEDPRTPLGTFKNVDYMDVFIPFFENDVFIFYSDAFIESQNKLREVFGYQRFENAIMKHYESGISGLTSKVLTELDIFTDKMPQYDDESLILIKINATVSKEIDYSNQEVNDQYLK